MPSSPRRSVAIPEELKLFLVDLWKKVPTELAVAELDLDDLFETEKASASLEEEGGDTFIVTYRGEPGEHWHFPLRHKELSEVVVGVRTEVEVRVEDVPIGGRLAELLDALMGGGALEKDEPEEEEEDDPFAAPELLELLLKEGHVELEEGADQRSLARGISQQLALERTPAGQARKLSEWLLCQDCVEEVYIDDDSLEALLAAW